MVAESALLSGGKAEKPAARRYGQKGKEKSAKEPGRKSLMNPLEGAELVIKTTGKVYMAPDPAQTTF